jgi:hypothetical protein
MALRGEPEMSVLPDDGALTVSGQDFEPATAKVLLIACGAIARETLAIIRENGWQHLSIQCLPAILHNSPEKITDAVKNAVAENSVGYDKTYILYADCGTGGQLQAACAELGVEMLSGPHCYSFFEGNEIFAKRSEDEFTAFYLTDFLVRQFDAFVIRPLGLDKHPELRDMYFGNYEKLVYQAQTDDPVLDEKAKKCADILGLTYERRKTGFGDLKSSLESWIAP